MKRVRLSDAARYQKAAESFGPLPASYDMPSSSRSFDLIREETRAIELPESSRNNSNWPPDEMQTSRRLTRSATKRYREASRTFTSAPFDPPPSEPPDLPQKEAHTVVPLGKRKILSREIKKSKQSRPLTRAAAERYRKVAEALESPELHRGESIKPSDEVQEAAQNRPAKRDYFKRPVRRADAERYEAAKRAFEKPSASYDMPSSRSFDLVREGARAVEPQANQHMTDKNHLITIKSMYDMLDQEIIKDLSNPTTRDNLKAFFRFNMKRRYSDKVSILSMDQPIGNCHTYALTRKREGWLSGEDVETILADNGYRIVATTRATYEAPQKGDLVIYRLKDPTDPTGKITLTHSGVFSRREGNELYVTSRNGQYDEIEHTISFNEQLYGEWTIYHTDRPNGRFID